MDDDTLPSGWVVVCTELTDARQAEAGRRAAEERYEAVVASLSEGIILFDEAGKMSAHNQAAATILGSRLDDSDGHRLFTGTSIATSTDGFPLTPTMFPHVKTLDTGESEDGVVIGVTDEHGRRQWLSMSSRLLSGASQTDAPMVVCSFTDVTDRRAAEAQLHWLAYHDSLTGLGNRSFFNDELERELLMSMQTTPAWPCSSSTSTVSSWSTTPSATPAVTSCCSSWPVASRRRPARATWSAGSAATSSWCCARTCASEHHAVELAERVLEG